MRMMGCSQCWAGPIPPPWGTCLPPPRLCSLCTYLFPFSGPDLLTPSLASTVIMDTFAQPVCAKPHRWGYSHTQESFCPPEAQTSGEDQ